jgi:hypothetical protein
MKTPEEVVREMREFVAESTYPNGRRTYMADNLRNRERTYMADMVNEWADTLEAWLAHYDADPTTHHPNLYLLAVERTGWRRWIFGRWVYNSEPFRRDIQRRCADCNFAMQIRAWERLYSSEDKP